MKVNHRIATRFDKPFWREIEALGLAVDRENDLIWVVNVTEDHPAWPQVERLLDKHEVGGHLITCLFTKDELDAAEWLQVSALGQHGYPQPEDDLGYIDETYEMADYCRHCGMGAVQRGPLRLRAEPKASHSQFIQLNWVFDELLVRKPAQEGILAADVTGVEFLAPVLHKSGTPSRQVAQMRIATHLAPALDLAGLEPVTCVEHNEEWSPKQPDWVGSRSRGYPYCGRVKYHYMHKGPFRFRRDVFKRVPDAVKSHESFGSGGSAFRLIVVSQRFRRLVVAEKWRGIAFEPIELMD